MCAVVATQEGSARVARMASCRRRQPDGKALTGSQFAFVSTAQAETATPHPVLSLTSVPGVARWVTAPRTPPDPSPYPIVTPLRWQEWESALRKAGILERFSDVPSGIHYGFSLGVSSTITSIFSPKTTSPL